jgi:GNAT superfamily N-acetyltransferase
MSQTLSRETAKDPIEIRRRSDAEREALDDMYRDVFGEEAALRNRARWRWQYEENPYCPPEGPEIWIAKESRDGGLVLGQYATMPVRLLAKGRSLRASWGMDVMVRPNLQRKGVGSRLFLYWDKNVEASLGLGLSLQSYTLFKKLQWEDVGPVPCFSKALDPRALLERRLGATVASALAPALRAALALAFPWRRTRSEAVVVSPLEGEFGPEYDALWEEASPAYDFVAERRSRYLEWKYHRPPHVSYDVLEARRNGKLTGYTVVRVAVRNGARLALLVDLFAHPDDRESLGALLDRALEWARERAASRMQAFTFDRRIAARLSSKGFFLIESPMQFCLRIHSDHVDETFFRDTSRWHVTFGDSDQDREP